MTDDTEIIKKYPFYLISVGIVYIAFLILALSVIPSAFYSLENGIFILLMIAPLIVGVMYFFEKPAINLKYYRYLLIVLVGLFLFFFSIIIYIFF